jgi:hypothetical protein
MIGVDTRAQVTFEDRGLRFLDLQEERISAVVPQEQEDITARPDAPHTDHFLSHIHTLVFAQQHAPILLDRWPVRFHQPFQLVSKSFVIEVRDEGRIILDPVLATDWHRDFGKYLQA